MFEKEDKINVRNILKRKKKKRIKIDKKIKKNGTKQKEHLNHENKKKIVKNWNRKRGDKPLDVRWCMRWR